GAVHRVLEVKMDELKWEMLEEVFGRMEAELIKSYLEAHGIEVELFQEAVGHHIYPTTIDGMGRVQVFVAKENAKKASKLLKEFQENTNKE
ncbi:MAG: DUF2007 domain-containing protein, partial [Chloroflexota bacterium]